MRIEIDDQHHLTELRIGDVPALVELLNCPEIYQNTLSIVSPYNEADAESWIVHNHQIFDDRGKHFNLAIRNVDHELIGAIGLLGIIKPHEHRSEVGYWLGKPFWNQGIMTRVLPVFLDYAFREFCLSKITAHVFRGNRASERVLKKNGFHKEGLLKMHYIKDNRPIDAVAFGLLKSQHRSPDRKR